MTDRLMMTGALAVVLVVAGCSGDGSGSARPSNSSDPTTSKVPECLQELEGPGDLEITDQVLTVMGSESEGFKASYVLELTNHNDTDTAMAAVASLRLVNDDGKKVMRADDEDEEARDSGEVEYVEPGESKYIAGTFVEELAEEPVDMTIDFPSMAGPGLDNKTFWWPHDDVDYPPKLEADNVAVLDDGSGGKGLSFDLSAEAEPDQSLEYINPVTVLRDSNGDLVGGQYSGVFSLNDSSPIEYPPDQAELPDAFPDGFPPGTDPSDIDVQLNYAPPWDEVDDDCGFGFDPY